MKGLTVNMFHADNDLCLQRVFSFKPFHLLLNSTVTAVQLPVQEDTKWGLCLAPSITFRVAKVSASVLNICSQCLYPTLHDR